MNKVKKKVYRNTTSFNMMAWGSFAFFVILMLVGLYTLKEPLMVKGYSRLLRSRRRRWHRGESGGRCPPYRGCSGS